MARAAILDVDGTLVDTNYHHALCWSRAFGEQGIAVPLWRLHRHVGMGGDKYVAAVAGDAAEEQHGEALRRRWEELFDEQLEEVRPLPGARELVTELKGRGLAVVLASSAVSGHLEAFLDLLDIRDVADAWTTKDDVDESKPSPDLVAAGLEQAGTRDAVMVGDTPWDCRAAGDAGIPTIAVRTGGFPDAELRDAGAIAVYDDADELRRRLDETPLGGG